MVHADTAVGEGDGAMKLVGVGARESTPALGVGFSVSWVGVGWSVIDVGVGWRVIPVGVGDLLILKRREKFL